MSRQVMQLALDALEYTVRQGGVSAIADVAILALKEELLKPEPVPICRHCGGEMRPGKALEQTWHGEPEWPGDTLYTMSPSGPGKLIACMKCEKCGYSTHKEDV